MRELLKTFHALLAAVTPEEAQENSFLNYHVPGIDYLCLLRTPQLTAKVYMTRPEDLVTCGEGGFLVNPHSHAYDFHQVVVAGYV